VQFRPIVEEAGGENELTVNQNGLCRLNHAAVGETNPPVLKEAMSVNVCNCPITQHCAVRCEDQVSIATDLDVLCIDFSSIAQHNFSTCGKTNGTDGDSSTIGVRNNSACRV
jgi:hypothetical protein